MNDAYLYTFFLSDPESPLKLYKYQNRLTGRSPLKGDSVMILGLPDPTIAFCFVALFVSTAFGLWYGIKNWNKGE